MPATLEPAARWQQVQERAVAIRKETARVIVGQDAIVEQLLTSLLCKGHCLLVGVPGLAKTLLVVAVTHDLNIALQFSDRVMLLADGRIAGDGAPGEVLNPELIAQVFGVQATMHGKWMTYEG